jgi:hypothetical protein
MSGDEIWRDEASVVVLRLRWSRPEENGVFRFSGEENSWSRIITVRHPSGTRHHHLHIPPLRTCFRILSDGSTLTLRLISTLLPPPVQECKCDFEADSILQNMHNQVFIHITANSPRTFFTKTWFSSRISTLTTPLGRRTRLNITRVLVLMLLVHRVHPVPPSRHSAA